MKWLCYSGILKEGFSSYSSPVMLISHKLTQDKRVETDFRHLNIRIAKNNLAYPLVRDTFLVLGNSKCDILLVLDLKDTFHSLRLSDQAKKFCSIFPYFGSTSYIYQRMPMGLNISPSIWQSYINAILDCLEMKKTLWSNNGWSFTFYSHKESTYGKIRRFIEGFAKEWTQNITKKVPVI